MTIDDVRRAMQRPLLGLEAQARMAPPYRRDQIADDVESPGVQTSRGAHFALPAGWAIVLSVDPAARIASSTTRGKSACRAARRKTANRCCQTALREAQEEIGVDATAVEVIGQLSQLYVPPSNFCIQPFVGYVAQRPDFQNRRGRSGRVDRSAARCAARPGDSACGRLGASRRNLAHPILPVRPAQSLGSNGDDSVRVCSDVAEIDEESQDWGRRWIFRACNQVGSNRAASSRVLLAVFAHPDDETFGPGGTLARYAADGVDVHYACATRGEVGTVDAALMQGFATVGDLRWHELESAVKILGLTGLHWLGYRDSGMPGSEDNRHPMRWCRPTTHVLVGRVVAVIRALRPQVIITFDPCGGYGHPDHVSIHYATKRAFALAGDASQYPEQIAQGLEPFAPQKLYYTAFPKGFLKIAVTVLRSIGPRPGQIRAQSRHQSGRDCHVGTASDDTD